MSLARELGKEATLVYIYCGVLLEYGLSPETEDGHVGFTLTPSSLLDPRTSSHPLEV